MIVEQIKGPRISIKIALTVSITIESRNLCMSYGPWHTYLNLDIELLPSRGKGVNQRPYFDAVYDNEDDRAITHLPWICLYWEVQKFSAITTLGGYA